MSEPDNQSLEQAAIAAHQIKSPVGTLQTLIRTLLAGFAGALYRLVRQVRPKNRTETEETPEDK